jgi:hypothetical protein
MKKIIALWLLSASSVVHAAPSGREVLEHQEDARKIPSFQAAASLSTVKEGEAAKGAKKFRWWRKLGADKVHFLTLTRFDEPATIRGEGLLIREATGENDVKLYLPRFKKVRRVEGQSQSSSFMGSVFSYADLALPHADEGLATVLEEKPCPDGQAKCLVVEIKPATDKVRERTGYSRSVQWVRKDNWLTVYGEFFDKKNVLWKRLTATEIKEVDPKAHKWLAHSIKLEDVPARRVTLLKLTGVKVNVELADTLFTAQNLAIE